MNTQKPRINKDEWCTAKGEVLKIKNMTDTHLANAINLCLRNADQLKQVIVQGLESDAWSTLGYSCSSDTPDGASMAAGREADIIFSTADDIRNSNRIIVTDKAHELIKEAKCRNLIMNIPKYWPLSHFFDTET